MSSIAYSKRIVSAGRLCRAFDALCGERSVCFISFVLTSRLHDNVPAHTVAAIIIARFLAGKTVPTHFRATVSTGFEFPELETVESVRFKEQRANSCAKRDVPVTDLSVAARNEVRDRAQEVA